jgi:palmitoyl-protein thioesterase
MKIRMPRCCCLSTANRRSSQQRPLQRLLVVVFLGLCVFVVLVAPVAASAASAAGGGDASSADVDPADAAAKGTASNTNHHNNKGKKNNKQLCSKVHEWEDHPALCTILEALHVEEEEENIMASSRDDGGSGGGSGSSNSALNELHAFAAEHGMLVDLRRGGDEPRQLFSSSPPHSDLPVVLAHGMGDSCFNSGMQHVTATVAQWLSEGNGNSSSSSAVYTVCIPTGATRGEDTKNGYFLSMDASVDAFATAVASDPKLQRGFHALGFSQGNNVIRGYIAQHNSPAVHTFLSVNGVNAGIGAVPYCRPSFRDRRIRIGNSNNNNTSSSGTRGYSVCDLLMEQASKRAYTEFAQEHSFQANYWRDPRPAAQEAYRTFSQLARWNNEAGFINETLRTNWARTSQFVWILADGDSMVWPREGEWWGSPDPLDPTFRTILPMTASAWYVNDLFGLRTAQEHGRNAFESFPGDHLQFTEADLHRWVSTYLAAPPPPGSLTSSRTEDRRPAEGSIQGE